jgi:microcystin-dependent protein
MADQKITELVEVTAPLINNVLPLVYDPSGTPATRKATISSIISLVYPVGSLYISVVSTNPATLFGFGTWDAFAAGRTLIGIDGTQTEFDTVEETGGAKTHTLIAAEMPSHTHIQDSHNHTQNSHTHTQSVNSATTGGLSGYTPDTSTNTSVTSGYSTGATTATNQATTATNQNTGGGGAHNNLQPYIVVYMFKRTA